MRDSRASSHKSLNSCNEPRVRLARPQELKFPRVQLYGWSGHQAQLLLRNRWKRVQQRIREITAGKGKGVSIRRQWKNGHFIGWRGYFRFCETPGVDRPHSLGPDC